MLAALSVIGNDLNTANENDIQLVVLNMMLGFGLWQIIYGPISINTNRNPPIYTEIVIYILEA